MAEPSQIIFTYKEVAEALIKRQGLHEGIWGLTVRFGIQAVNAGENEDSLKPTAIVPLLELGLTKFEKETNLSIDAAKVNPRSKSKAK
jgi:hypothetical protein